jgi:HSP20 family protein
MANLAQWNPFEDMVTLREAMNQLVEDSVVRPMNAVAGQHRSFVPELNLSETENAFVVEATVPGIKPEDINITVENNVLTITGEAKHETESEGKTYHRIERRYGKFQRTITLPNTVKVDAINASSENGVLHVEIPKAEETKPRRITVNVGKTVEGNGNGNS